MIAQALTTQYLVFDGRDGNGVPAIPIPAATPTRCGEGTTVTRWWLGVSDADRAALVKSICVGSTWRAIKANLG